VAAAALLLSTAAIAEPPKTQAKVAPTFACRGNAVRIPDNRPVPTAHHAGKAIVTKTTIRNTTRTVFKPSDFRLEIGSPVKWRTPAPAVMWKLDRGPWRKLTFTWFDQAPKDPASIPEWDTYNAARDDPSIGTLAGRSIHTIQFKFTFSRRSHTGLYDGLLTVSGGDCYGLGVGGVDVIYKTALS
jgi:hypothetical protein